AHARSGQESRSKSWLLDLHSQFLRSCTLLVHTTTKSPHVQVPYSFHPNLGIWEPGVEAVRCDVFIRVNLIRPGLDIDRDEFPMVLWCQPRLDITLVNLVATSGEFFLTVSRMFDVHDELQVAKPAVGFGPQLRSSITDANRDGAKMQANSNHRIGRQLTP